MGPTKNIIVQEGRKKLTKKQIIEYYLGKLAKYKIPKYFEFIESLPVGPGGSIEKEKLKQRYG